MGSGSGEKRFSGFGSSGHIVGELVWGVSENNNENEDLCVQKGPQITTNSVKA